MNPSPISTLQPPGEARRVRVESALVVAPHYDDEVLGCGGLAAQIAAGGGRVEVLFLTDGAANAAPDEDAAAYSAARNEEAQAACARLGVAAIHHLELPDGRLDQQLDEVAQGLLTRLERGAFELLLTPSPLEISRDHQAAFAAVHRALSPLREESGAAVVRGLRILAYEVNRPLYPSLLVDISEQVSVLEEAMGCYGSQQRRHDYLAAGLGLARHRTLSLPPEVRAAEAYVELTPDDFSTRSLAWLIRHLGGLPELHEIRQGPRISVVVRTLDRPQLLAEALESLAEGTYRNAEVVLVNDGGRPPEVAPDFPLTVMRVELEENVGRAQAAQAGVEAASGDYVAFLDDDDLAAPEHLATLATLVQAAGVRVAYTDAAVGVYELDGEAGWKAVERRLPYSRDFDADLLLLDNYIPFNTLLIERALFDEVGPFDDTLPFFEDWDFLIRLARRTPFHHCAQVTCEYRHFQGGGHQIFGSLPRERSDFLAVKARVVEKHRDRLAPEALARTVDALRAEGVILAEELARARRDAAAELERHRREEGELAKRYFALEADFHRKVGEAAAARQEADQHREEVARLQGEERRLNADLAAQTEQIAATYAEIERLNGLLEQMESTRAWRFHQWWQRRLR